MKLYWKTAALSLLTALILAVPAAAEGLTLIEPPAPPPMSGVLTPSAAGRTVSLEQYARPEPVGNRWIDRVKLDDDLLVAYDALAEATDGDGVDDYLIDDKYYTPNPGVPKSVNEIGKVCCYYDDSGQPVTKMLIMKTETRNINDAYNQLILMYSAFLRDHPEVFWLYSFRYSYDDAGSGLHVYLILSDSSFRTITDEATLKTLISERDNNVQKILIDGGFTSSTTDLEKIWHFNDWLTHHNQYNTVDPNQRDAHTCIWALRGSTGASGPVCEGYSKAFKVLCDSQDIPCVLVDGASHMWNNVMLDGVWYAMDVTWNDPTDSFGAVSGDERESYSLVGSKSKIGYTPSSAKEFQADHPVSNNVFSGYDGGFRNGPKLSETACESLHDPIQWLEETPATCTEPGIQSGVCKHCGGLYVQRQSSPPLGHDWHWVEDDAGYHAQCSRDPYHFDQTLAFHSIHVNWEIYSCDGIPAQDGLHVFAQFTGAYYYTPFRAVIAYYGRGGQLLKTYVSPVRGNFTDSIPLNNANGAVADIKCFAVSDDFPGHPMIKSIQYSTQKKAPEAEASGAFFSYLPALQNAWSPEAGRG